MEDPTITTRRDPTCPKCKFDECECNPQVTFTMEQIEAWLTSDAKEGLQKHDDYFTVGRMIQSMFDENLELRRKLQAVTREKCNLANTIRNFIHVTRGML